MSVSSLELGPPPHHLSCKWVCPPPRDRGGYTLGGGVGVPIRTTGEKAQHSVLLCGVIHKLPALSNREQIEFFLWRSKKIQILLYGFLLLLLTENALYQGTLRFILSRLLSKESSKGSEPGFEPRTCLVMVRRANNPAIYASPQVATFQPNSASLIPVLRLATVSTPYPIFVAKPTPYVR